VVYNDRMSDDLTLNRLRKRGQSLILEEHSSCEVPAGCGGVVLRWVRPDAPCAVDLRHFASTPAKIWIDGTGLERERVVLAPGPHVLCFEYSTAERAVLMAALKLCHRQVPRMKLLTAADGTWRCSWAEPVPLWTALDLDDSAWEPMVAHDVPDLSERTSKWRVEWLTGEGATPIGSPSRKRRGFQSRSPTLRVRRRFELTAEGLS
jgi:hypothetical protein